MRILNCLKTMVFICYAWLLITIAACNATPETQQTLVVNGIQLGISVTKLLIEHPYLIKQRDTTNTYVAPDGTKINIRDGKVWSVTVYGD